MVIRGKPNASKLRQIYNTIQKIIDNQECYYTEEEIEKLRKDENNIFLEKRK